MKWNVVNSLKNKINRFLTQENGTIAILTGLVFVILIGFAALAIDVSLWYSEKRQLQFAADAGAVGGAIALQTSGKSKINAYATNDINLNNCTEGNGCTIVAINNPPTSGTTAGNTNAVEVLLSKPADMYFGQFFLGGAPTLHSRAVAGLQPSTNCASALSPSGVGIGLTGNVNINAPNCGFYANSSSNNAINLVGNATLTVKTVGTVGKINKTGNVTINASGGETTGGSPIADPLSNVTIPSFSGCTQTNYSLTGNNVATINPGVYCGGIQLTGNSTLTMNPGVYYINKGDFQLSGNTTVNGTGVTVIMTSSTGSGYGSVDITGNAILNMSAPTTGSTAGILFFGDRNSSGISENFTGNDTQNLNGTIYFPTNNLNYVGNAGVAGSTCLQIIAYTISFTGNAGFGNGCGTNSSLGVVQMLE